VEYRRTGFGLGQWSGEDIILAGGTRCPGFYGEGLARLRFDAYGVPELAASGNDHRKARVAVVELVCDVTGDEPRVVSLISIEVPRELRRRGYGRRVVEAVAGLAPDGLRITDIRRAADGFWLRMGVEMPPRVPGRRRDGVLPAPPVHAMAP